MVTELLADTWGRFTTAVSELDDEGLTRPTRTTAWTVADLTYHLLLDAQRALVAIASPTDESTDVDRVTYWRPFRPDTGDGGADHARFVVASASAHSDPASVVSRWAETSAAAARAVRAADPKSHVRTQGHVLTCVDFVSTLLVEATVHLLDLDLGAAPCAEALLHTRDVLDALLGEPLSPTWDDTEAVLRGTGRLPVDDDRFPLLG